MIKYKLALAYVLLSSLASAHSMSPIEFGGKSNPLQSISVTGVVLVPIEVGTKAPKVFAIEVDGVEFNRIQVAKDSIAEITVPVRLNNPNVVENHTVCSVGQGIYFNTKICTKVKAYWLQRSPE